MQYCGNGVSNRSHISIRMPKAKLPLEAQFDNAVVRGQPKSVRLGTTPDRGQTDGVVMQGTLQPTCPRGSQRLSLLAGIWRTSLADIGSEAITADKRYLLTATPLTSQVAYGSGGAHDYLSRTMSKHLGSVLTEVNAPYSDQLDGAALAHCLIDIDLAKQHPGHISAFLSQVPLASKSSSQLRTTSQLTT